MNRDKRNNYQVINLLKWIHVHQKLTNNKKENDNIFHQFISIPSEKENRTLLKEENTFGKIKTDFKYHIYKTGEIYHFA